MPVLTGIYSALTGMVGFIVTGLVTWINLMIVAIAGALGLFIGLLPSMPAAPAPPQGSWLDWLNWAVPVADLIAGLLVFVGLWAVYLLVRIPLRWLRAL